MVQKLAKKVPDPGAALAAVQDVWRATVALVHQPMGQALCLFAYGVRVSCIAVHVRVSGRHGCNPCARVQEVMTGVHMLPEAAHAFQAAGSILETSLQRCPHVGRDLLQWEAWQPSPLTAKCWENVVVRGCAQNRALVFLFGQAPVCCVCVRTLQAVITARRRAGTGPSVTDAAAPAAVEDTHLKELELQAHRKLLALAKRVYPVASEQVAGHTASVAVALYDLGRFDEACDSMQMAIWGRVVIAAAEVETPLPPVCRPHRESTLEYLLMLVVRGVCVCVCVWPQRICPAGEIVVWGSCRCC